MSAGTGDAAERSSTTGAGDAAERSSTTGAGDAAERSSTTGAGSGPLGLDPVLLEILACPAPDHGELRPGTPDDPAAAALTCQVCGRRFPVTDGIPVLLLSEATGGPDDAGPGPGHDTGSRDAAGGDAATPADG